MVTQTTAPVDVDDAETWPREIIDIVAQWAEDCRGATEYSSDLPLALEDEPRFRQLLSGRLVRAYHCTRLFPHEVGLVREVGLRPLSPALLSDRIDAAEAAGAISTVEAENLRAAHVFATGERGYRANKVCLILSRRMFRDSLGGCLPLLTTWGGEGIYMSSKGVRLRPWLESLGTPTVVVAHLDLSDNAAGHRTFPPLHNVFVGAALDLPHVGADVLYMSPVLPEHIERILQPGDSDYEMLGDLPR
jgi:hypothetical protein